MFNMQRRWSKIVFEDAKRLATLWGIWSDTIFKMRRVVCKCREDEAKDRAEDAWAIYKMIEASKIMLKMQRDDPHVRKLKQHHFKDAKWDYFQCMRFRWSREQVENARRRLTTCEEEATSCSNCEQIQTDTWGKDDWMSCWKREGVTDMWGREDQHWRCKEMADMWGRRKRNHVEEDARGWLLLTVVEEDETNEDQGWKMQEGFTDMWEREPCLTWKMCEDWHNLLLSLSSCKTAINSNDLTIDPFALGTDNEGHHSCNVFRFAQSFQRRLLGQGLYERLCFTLEEKICGHRPWRHTIGGDFGPSELLCQDLGERLHRGFAGSVGSVVGDQGSDKRGGYVDNATTFSRWYTKRRFLAGQESSLRIHSIDSFPILLRCRRNSRIVVGYRSCAVHNDVDFAERFFGLIEQWLDRARAAHIPLHCDGLAMFTLDLGDDFIGFLLVARVVHHHRRSLLSKVERNLPPNSLWSSRHYGCLSLQRRCHLRSCKERTEFK